MLVRHVMKIYAKTNRKIKLLYIFKKILAGEVVFSSIEFVDTEKQSEAA